jgi:hypothetical protein
MNTQSATIELHAVEVQFYSSCDESAFFGWLRSLSCVERFEGRRRILHIWVNAGRVDEGALRELLALFNRYRIDLTQLAVFDRDDFADWFRRDDAYWHEGVFRK